jgi:hypothetical protein
VVHRNPDGGSSPILSHDSHHRRSSRTTAPRSAQHSGDDFPVRQRTGAGRRCFRDTAARRRKLRLGVDGEKVRTASSRRWMCRCGARFYRGELSGLGGNPARGERRICSPRPTLRSPLGVHARKTLLDVGVQMPGWLLRGAHPSAIRASGRERAGRAG